MKKVSRVWGLEQISLSPSNFNALRLKYALSALQKANGKVLEAGCGAGAFARVIKKCRPDLEVIGCDIEHNLIKTAKKTGNDILFLEANVEKLPFGDNSLDAVVTFDVVEHLAEPVKAYNEIFRVLKRGGIFHSAIPLEASLFTIHGLLLKIGLKPKEIYAGHVGQYKSDDILRLLKKTGFTYTNSFYSGHFSYQLIDFLYFFILSFLKRKPKHTIEGYIEVLPTGIKRNLILSMRFLLAFISYYESLLLRNIPGQIGHFIAYKK